MVDILRMRTTSSRSSTYPKNVQSATTSRFARLLMWHAAHARMRPREHDALAVHTVQQVDVGGEAPLRQVLAHLERHHPVGRRHVRQARRVAQVPSARASPACRSHTERRYSSTPSAPSKADIWLRGRRLAEGAALGEKRAVLLEPAPMSITDFEPTSAWICIATPPSRKGRARATLANVEGEPTVRAARRRRSGGWAGIDASPPRPPWRWIARRAAA